MNRNIVINNDKLDVLEPTKNLYMVSDSILQQRINKNHFENKTNINFALSKETALPDFGINMGSMKGDILSANPVCIENEMFGLNTLNGKYQMKKRRENFTPRIKNLDKVKFFEVQEKVHLPNPLIIEKNQRPEIF